MRILITTNHPAPYIDKWLEVLSMNHQVDALYFKKKSSEKEWKNYRVKDAFYNDDFSFRDLLCFFKTYDFIVFGGWFKKINILYCVLLKFTNTKTAFFTDYPEIENQGKFHSFIKKRIIESADYLFAASYSTKEFFIEKYRIKDSKVRVFPYAHNFEFESEPNVIFDKIKIFIANRFIERKGYKIVIDSFRVLKEVNKLDEFEITIVGGGPQYNFYKNEFKKLSDNIVVKEWIEDETYIKYMKASNIYIHASIFEPFGIPPLDALQLNKIVIVSDGVKSLNHIKGKVNNPIIYNSTDHEELSNILINISIVCHNLNTEESNHKIITEMYNAHTLLRAIPKFDENQK
ncbi:glycosyltransferase family 4 protein [Chryseobacterium foetidum]|uniref:glycosyltransferase family 4 protein n=1 Tax=Chryseobacterium foetidum TaxID=2951057 RepID=UPI0021C5FA98|nr:glycosyltransferase family 4 protein [Chryseobacterium foetidum]